jgi:hypothetical protein
MPLVKEARMLPLRLETELLVVMENKEAVELLRNKIPLAVLIVIKFYLHPRKIRVSSVLLLTRVFVPKGRILGGGKRTLKSLITRPSLQALALLGYLEPQVHSPSIDMEICTEGLGSIMESL